MQCPSPSPSASATSATTIRIVGAVGASETVETRGAVREQWAVGLRRKVWGKEDAEGKEQYIGKRQ